ncbi:hypothetical protein NC653_005573 [Populus alba x Populus x berolinensis]|uniref:Uncharacterized protein n=1 Tax=Populus alba x Populus x berolinensis TaxID=444605 RepID=A0AAD6RC91_9ROSI|nr:hypothetical protein NC653_005573 [Populus alba x Populus x berolinensis]
MTLEKKLRDGPPLFHPWRRSLFHVIGLCLTFRNATLFLTSYTDKPSRWVMSVTDSPVVRRLFVSLPPGLKWAFKFQLFDYKVKQS